MPRMEYKGSTILQRPYNERNGVSNHQRLDYLLNHLFKRLSKKTSKFGVTGLCEGNSPVTRKMLSFDDFIMIKPWRCRSNSIRILFKFIMQNSSSDTRCKIDLMWMSGNDPLMRSQHWFRSTRHYLSQCWPKSPTSVPGSQSVDCTDTEIIYMLWK